MMVALIEHRADLGKETDSRHFMTENRLCNWTITGSFDAIDESTLTIEEVQLLAYARRTNERLIMADIPYDERKRMLAYKVENKRRKLWDLWEGAILSRLQPTRKFWKLKRRVLKFFTLATVLSPKLS
jgi:hypothetical protein